MICGMRWDGMVWGEAGLEVTVFLENRGEKMRTKKESKKRGENKQKDRKSVV